jgi:lactoylglutathione lyase
VDLRCLSVDLAKEYLDVGLYTDRYDELRSFYVDELGLAYEELLRIGGGVHQHRVSLNGAVLKLNSSLEALEPSATNYVGLEIGMDAERRETLDPDGTRIVLGPGRTTCIHWASSNPARLRALLRDGLGAGEAARQRLRVGGTEIELHSGGVTVGPMRARGFRYITVQVRDVRTEHARLVSQGWQELRPPVRLGDTAFISFVSDFDGSPVEISQRASLTGPLPEA